MATRNKSKNLECLPEWQTSTVLGLTEHVIQEGLHDLPILADGLQDAGCDNNLLDYCRSDKTHEQYLALCKIVGWDTKVPGHWVVPVPKGITCNLAVAALRKAGVKVSTYQNDLNKVVTVHNPDSGKKGYTVTIKANPEADQENAGKSANVLKMEGHKGMTLPARLLLELPYFKSTGKHLDNETWTLCAGSRRSDGYVPRVRWCSDYRKVCVYWRRADHSDDGLRSRSVVSVS